MLQFHWIDKIITILIIEASCNKYEEYRRVEDKLALNVEDLIDLVYEEQKQILSSPLISLDKMSSQLLSEIEKSTTENSRKNPEKIRKIWSRWSKWSECSVTCGSGLMSRQRACVAGRCAPGEREEQRRTCDRAPCCLLSDTSFNSDDFREID